MAGSENSWARRSVLVTGAGGFIGSHLAERLVDLGARTRALVRYSSSGSWGWLEMSPVRDDLEVIAADIADSTAVRRAMGGVDVVFHLAALIGIPYSYDAPLSYVRTNVEGSLNVFQAAREAGVGRVVHTSTSEVYGTAQYVPIDERHPLQGQSPYSASKIAADHMAEAYYRSFALPVVTVRPFNTYGPRQSLRAVVPTIIKQCLNGPQARLGNLHPTRDLNFVTDTVEGFVRAAVVEGVCGQAINIGTGKEISIENLVRKISTLIGVDPDVQVDALRVRPPGSEVERLCADASRARSLLGWSPQVSLDEGLTRTIEWMRANRETYRRNTYVV